MMLLREGGRREGDGDEVGARADGCVRSLARSHSQCAPVPPRAVTPRDTACEPPGTDLRRARARHWGAAARDRAAEWLLLGPSWASPCGPACGGSENVPAFSVAVSWRDGEA
jgi:hypothetical protein